MKILPIKIKGSIFTLLVLYLQNHPVELFKNNLRDKIKNFPTLFKNAPIAINVEKCSNEINWNNIKNAIISCGFNIIGVSGCKNGKLKNNIIKSGLPILSEGKEVFNFFNNINLDDKILSFEKKNYNKTPIFNSPIRSGQKIYANNSDLIITNNVNSGAEVIADGNIHIYGEVRGRVLAGAKGDNTCQIFCTKLFSELVAISGEYLLSGDFSEDTIGNSVKIYMKNKKLHIVKLN
ncbi:putative septum site-determining protein MinC [Buchnera aphidicola str. Bp (Baizongia pistaciae)]|uniref:Probable septum site-determining protein MinC n=1 Tax=Buchnera aphidicola subsp. Baizongia pistaciae (strain Bp) TaxID=224915 RepID=MINC_BUCBP|nr:septum site-determining protein MinC [Buchnera aphidicola]P59503.1 RecName: Full=Probable septum site-determining protein MinC [Buchnera aphidicola str. Bp (Baizongia pistaciae)]AAO27029.1 putative septum site-determining protein MinC [Buchnera aphidicola str. Bp (Baizongia pistaciae)]